jgi:hypothetical protein
MASLKLLIPAVVAVVVIVVVLVVLWYVVPKQFAEERTLSLNYEQNPPWRTSICIPGTTSGNPDYTTVSFNWTTSPAQRVTLVIWPSGNIPDQSVYNMTASSGNGSYSSQGTEYFSAFGVTNVAVVVTIDISYALPGHYFGGPIAGPNC